jgi:coproporphyrinogen III oxidase-like Fe-S oxidoreductase
VSSVEAMGAGARLGPGEVVGSFDGPVGAYVHVPFCEWICPFCPYNKVRADPDLARRYFAALHREIDRYLAEFEAVRREPFTSLYLGGGTPTLYPDELADVIARIPVSGERAVEVLPDHGTPERLDGLAGMGVTAVSIGAQSFHDAVLRRLGRPHDAATSLAAVRNAIGRFACVDVDLIVDVALEDGNAFPGAFLDDVRTCFGLGVDQVSTYPLMRFGYTPFGTAAHDRRKEHEVLAAVTELADAMGYERRSVWTFNRRGSPAYTSITRRRFLGMGAGSSSFAGRDFYVNHFGVLTYAEALEHGRLPVARWLRLGTWGGAAYDAFWQAYAGGVDPRLLERSYGRRVAEAARVVLAPLALAGLVRRAPHGYRLSRPGFDVYHDLERLVTYQMIEPLWAEMLTERATGEGCPDWVIPEKARAGRAWWLTRRLLERPLATDRGAG